MDRSGNGMSTLSDVADLAGVSKATASRALSRPELVAADTRERVVQAAATLDFAPSRVARALANGRTGLIAIVVPNLTNSFFAPIIEGAQEAAEQAGYQLTIAVRTLDAEADAAAIERLSHQVDGFLMTAPHAEEPVLRSVSALAPTVLVEREIDGIPSVIADAASAFGRLAAELVDAGHSNIAYVGGPDGSWPDRRRTEAIRAAIGDRATLTVVGPYPPVAESGFTAAPEVIACGATATIVYASAVSLGLMLALEARGVRTPQDMVVSGDARMAKSIGTPGIPSIDVDGAELGRTAMGLLLGALAARGRRDTSAASPAPLVQTRIAVPLHWS